MHRHCFWVTCAGGLPIPVWFMLEMGSTPGAHLSGPEGWGREKAPCHYVRGKDSTFFFQENETCLIPNSPGPAEIEGQPQHSVTIQFYAGISNILQENSGVSSVPKSWHISQFSNCCTETTAGCKTLESYLNMIQQNKNYIMKKKKKK